MHSGKNKPGGATQNHPMKVGFYDDSLKSKQAVPCGAGKTPVYLRDGFERAMRNKRWNEHWDTPEHKLASQQMFQGGYTFPQGRGRATEEDEG